MRPILESFEYIFAMSVTRSHISTGRFVSMRIRPMKEFVSEIISRFQNIQQQLGLVFWLYMAIYSSFATQILGD